MTGQLDSIICACLIVRMIAAPFANKHIKNNEPMNYKHIYIHICRLIPSLKVRHCWRCVAKYLNELISHVLNPT